MLAFGLLALSGCRDQTPVRLGAAAMGTSWTLLVADAISKTKSNDLRALIERELQALEFVASHWQSDSALSTFNQSASTEWANVPSSLYEMVAWAQRVGRNTDGALDITAAPLVELWGFGPVPRRDAPPAEAEIQQAMKNVGAQYLELNPNTKQIRKTHPAVKINVACLAEGYLMDSLISILKAEGVRNFLLEVGGEVAAFGQAPGGGPWQVGIQAPDGEKGEILETLSLTDLCVATSGTYRHRYEKGGRTYSHILDPRTGRPVEHGLISVSVIHEQAALADAYATALLVLGPQKGRETAARLGLRVIWIEENPGQ